MKKTLFQYLLLIFCTIAVDGFSQGAGKKIRIINADEGSYDESQSFVQKLKGNVIFEHDSSTMYCDIAYLNMKKNSFQAFSRIKVIRGDSMQLNGDTLLYYGQEKQADIKGNVVYQDRDMQLTTKALHYDFNTEIGSYTSVAVINSVKDKNTLSSKMGSYHSQTQDIFFKDSVRVTNEEYTMSSDTLIYNTTSKIATFKGPTTIVSDENTIYCENGWYDTQNEISSLWNNAKLTTKEQQLSGDSIHYNRNTGIGEIYGHVLMKDTVNKIDLLGEFGYHDERLDSSVLSHDATMIQYFEKDTLLLRSEQIIMKNDSIEKCKKLRAYHNVHLFKSDFQGVCDSLTYDESDSLMNLYGAPVLWSEKSQITGNFITLQTKKGAIDSMRVLGKAMLISEVDSTRFNQIKGKNIVAYFAKDKIDKVNVIGNGESLYYVENEDKPATDANYAKSRNITIRFVNDTIATIKFTTTPNATLKDIKTMDTNSSRLEGFTWLIEFRPKREDFEAILQLE